jgi:uncharacterized protein involved in exopolysaccharide biosynthesis
MFEPDGNGFPSIEGPGHLSNVQHPSRELVRRGEVNVVRTDLLSAPFRRPRLLTLCFLAAMAGVLLAVSLLPPKYGTEMKFLVKHERVDPVVTTDSNATRMASSGVVTEEEINSEVALMRGSDILQAVVVACGLDAPRKHLLPQMPGTPPETPAIRTAEATRRLAATLKIEPIRKSNLIAVSYTSERPDLSAHVLGKLAELYLAKHMTVHRPKGEFEFFRQQAELYRKRLDEAEAKLMEFGQSGTVAPQLQRDLLVRRADDFEHSAAQTRAAIAATTERIRTLEAQLATTPARLETQTRSADNPQLQEKLKTTLLNLHLKRTELAGKFEPTYRPLQELDTQIAQTVAAIESEEHRPLTEKSTDQNPTHLWLIAELAKARSELPMLEANLDATLQSRGQSRGDALTTDAKGYIQEDLARTVKAEEQNYLLYQQKQEEARIADALDTRRISNVVLAEPPLQPQLPDQSRAMMGLIGGLFAVMVSFGCTFAVDYLRPSPQKQVEAEPYLDLPVLAAIPHSTQPTEIARAAKAGGDSGT